MYLYCYLQLMSASIRIWSRVSFGTTCVFVHIMSLLPLDEAIASTAIFVCASDGRKRFWSQLNNSKTVRDRPYVSWGANRAGYRMSSSLSSRPQTEGSQIGDHRLSTACGVVERPDHHCGDDLVVANVRSFNKLHVVALFVAIFWPTVFSGRLSGSL